MSTSDFYTQQIDDIDSDLSRDKNVDHRFGTARVTSFAAASICGLTAMTGGGGVFWIATAVLMAVFIGLVIANEPVRQRLSERADARQTLARLLARTQRDWTTLERLNDPADPTKLLSARARAVASDLDLFGRASLFRLVSVCGTASGVRTLATWMTEPIESAASIDRADLSSSMVPARQQRIEFYRLAKTVGAANGDPDSLIEWAEGSPWMDKRRWLIQWATVSIVATVIAVFAFLFALLTGQMQSMWSQCSLYLLLAIPAINLGLSMTYLSPLHKIFAVAMTNRHSVHDYRDLIHLAMDLVGQKGDRNAAGSKNQLQARLGDALSDPESGAAAGFASLDKVSAAGSLRTSAATFLLYLPLQLYGLYDVWILRRLEDWQLRYRDEVRRWFDAVGSVEAVASLSAVRDEHPDWTTVHWTDPSDDDVSLKSETLGHPLLLADDRVCNDVTIGPKGTLLLVTGSNMSGKSTMLRSVGLNVALAGAGGPVCATRMSLPPIEMATSIRVSDDLSQGVSFYMAELKRLKSVVDQASEASRNNDRVCLFLLDEILQGTNSRERQIAVARVLDRLVNDGAIGAITTHDLELADDEQLMSKSHTVHFRETISQRPDGTDEMSFDYQMHDGVCPTTNAIRLLEIVGL